MKRKSKQLSVVRVGSDGIVKKNMVFSGQMPDIIERSNYEWVYFGKDNLYPFYLLELFNRSNKHGSIVKDKLHYMAGGGFTFDESEITPEQKLSLENFIENPNRKETLNDILKKVVMDFEMGNRFYLKPIFSVTGKLIGIEHLDASKIRSNINNSLFFYSNEWYQKGYSGQVLLNSNPDVMAYNVFNPQDRSLQGKPQIIFWHHYSQDIQCYPLPEYTSSLTWIETDIEIADFHNANVKNRFVGDTIIIFPYNPTEEEKADAVAKIKGEHTGSENAGGIITVFADGASNAPQIVHLQPSELDKQYESLNNTCRTEILMGHRIKNPLLFGIETAGKLGSRDELIEAYELMKTTYFKPRQEIIENIFNYVAEQMGLPPVLKIKELPPVTQSVEIKDIWAAMNEKEKREWMKENVSIAANIDLAAEQVTAPATQKNFSKENINEVILDLFDKYGEPKENYEVIKSRAIKFAGGDDALRSELSLYQSNFAGNVLTTLAGEILGLISNDPKISITDIAKTIKVSAEDVRKELLSAEKENLVTISESEIKITKQGRFTLKEVEPKTLTDIFIKYEYSEVEGIPEAKESRDFCSKLMAKNKFYSREEIDLITEGIEQAEIDGWNAWQWRGGFYTNPKTKETTPYCRHEWSQVLAKKKNK